MQGCLPRLVASYTSWGRGVSQGQQRLRAGRGNGNSVYIPSGLDLAKDVLIPNTLEANLGFVVASSLDFEWNDEGAGSSAVTAEK